MYRIEELVMFRRILPRDKMCYSDQVLQDLESAECESRYHQMPPSGAWDHLEKV